jgi:hypothetical protein
VPHVQSCPPPPPHTHTHMRLPRPASPPLLSSSTTLSHGSPPRRVSCTRASPYEAAHSQRASSASLLLPLRRAQGARTRSSEASLPTFGSPVISCMSNQDTRRIVNMNKTQFISKVEAVHCCPTACNCKQKIPSIESEVPQLYKHSPSHTCNQLTLLSRELSTFDNRGLEHCSLSAQHRSHATSHNSSYVSCLHSTTEGGREGGGTHA